MSTLLWYSLFFLGILLNANILTPENAVLGQPSMITCEVNASFPIDTNLLSVCWMHRENGLDITGNGFTYKNSFVYVTNLVLEETTVEQSGLYSCNVSLDTDRQQLTTEENLTVSCE